MSVKKEEMRPRKAPEKIRKDKFFGIPLSDEQEVFANTIWSDKYDIIFCNSKAGTGKSQVAVGTAKLLHDYGKYSQIIYIMAPYGERKQGWLPGTITEKSSIYFEPFYQAFIKCGGNINVDIHNESLVNQKQDRAYVTCLTDSFLRGTNLDDAVVIIDEAQNFTIPQLKTVLTRIGTNTKVIVIGHDQQCDLEVAEQSGFLRYLNHFKDQPRCSVCVLTQNFRGWISQHADDYKEKNYNPVIYRSNPLTIPCEKKEFRTIEFTCNTNEEGNIEV